MTIKDKAGQSFDGSSTYRLTVPTNPPVKQYWSATAYDRATHTLIRNLPWASRSSQTPGVQKNVDGSVDVYFGPKAPADKESNWVPTSTYRLTVPMNPPVKQYARRGSISNSCLEFSWPGASLRQIRNRASECSLFVAPEVAVR
jgi:hypothetical protein